MKKHMIIFDLDGTLLDTLQDLATACNYALEKSSLPTHETAAYRQFVGNGVYKLVERMIPQQRRGDSELKARLKAGFDEYYDAHMLDFTKPYDGVIPMLDTLSERGIAACVLSNKPDAFTRSLCKRFFGDRLLLARGQRDGWPIKPDARLVKSILDDTGFETGQTAYAGDSGVDMQTAKNGGLYAIGVLWGFRDESELKQNGADVLVKAPAEIPELIAR